MLYQSANSANWQVLKFGNFVLLSGVVFRTVVAAYEYILLYRNLTSSSRGPATLVSWPAIPILVPAHFLEPSLFVGCHIQNKR